MSEQFMAPAPVTDSLLAQLAVLYRCVPHGTELSIGSHTRLDRNYLDQLAELVERIDAPWFSDHLCLTEAGGYRLGHLAPIQWSQESAQHIARRVRDVESHVGRTLLLENLAYDFVLPGELTEPQFLTSVVDLSGCHLLLDIANVYINSVNHHFDAADFVESLPLERVVQLHVAGGQWRQGILEDSHSSAVPDQVWELARHVISLTPISAVLVERDTDFPADLSELLRDVAMAQQAMVTEPQMWSG